MSDQQPQKDRIDFKRAEPQLVVADLDRALSFYTERLGFGTRFTYGEPPFYAQVARGGAHLNLRLAAEGAMNVLTPKGEAYLAATICVESIKELFRTYQEQGVEFQRNLRTEPWGARTFIVEDPDGNLILFAE